MFFRKMNLGSCVCKHLERISDLSWKQNGKLRIDGFLKKANYPHHSLKVVTKCCLIYLAAFLTSGIIGLFLALSRNGELDWIYLTLRSNELDQMRYGNFYFLSTGKCAKKIFPS